MVGKEIVLYPIYQEVRKSTHTVLRALRLPRPFFIYKSGNPVCSPIESLLGKPGAVAIEKKERGKEKKKKQHLRPEILPAVSMSPRYEPRRTVYKINVAGMPRCESMREPEEAPYKP